MDLIENGFSSVWNSLQNVVDSRVIAVLIAISVILLVYFVFVRLFLSLLKGNSRVKWICDIMICLVCVLVVFNALLPTFKVEKVDRSVITNGTLEITENGIYDVESYASVDVDVPSAPASLPAAYHQFNFGYNRNSGDPSLQEIFYDGVVNFKPFTANGEYQLNCYNCDVSFNSDFNAYELIKMGPTSIMKLSFTSCTVSFDSSVLFLCNGDPEFYFLNMSASDVIGLSSSIFDSNIFIVYIYVSPDYYQSFVDLNLGSQFYIGTSS